jgi:periplasmic divalent cation tolerance protein
MYKLVYVITGDEKEAETIGNILIEEKLAAGVNLFPVRSIYRWKGKIQKDEEIAMILKTKTELVDTIINRVKELHSYEVPCIVSLPIEKGYAQFLNWIDRLGTEVNF